MTSYNVSESDEVVEVCINAVGTTSSCPSTESFHVTLSTSHRTAGSYQYIKDPISMSQQLGNEVERQEKANKSTTPRTALSFQELQYSLHH